MKARRAAITSGTNSVSPGTERRKGPRGETGSPSFYASLSDEGTGAAPHPGLFANAFSAPTDLAKR
jgi:hypothetical protein